MSAISQIATISSLKALFILEFEDDPQQLCNAMQQSGAVNKRLSQVGDAAASLSLWNQWFLTTQSRGVSSQHSPKIIILTEHRRWRQKKTNVP